MKHHFRNLVLDSVAMAAGLGPLIFRRRKQ